MAQAATRTSAPPSPQLGFQTLERELVVDQLPVEGRIPAWLRGSLLRTGPAKFEVGEQRMRHWFDGLAMLHRFSVRNGQVSYGSRLLDSQSYRGDREGGHITFSEFATDPCRSLFKRVWSLFFTDQLPDNANINVAQLGKRFIALTETPLPVEFDPKTLATARVRPYKVPGHLSTAHPHTDRQSGALLNYAAKLGPRSSYRFFFVDARGKSEIIASIPVAEPAYNHSFGLTERWLVLVEFPFVVNPLRLALANKPYIENYRWKPDRGTRFHLVDRRTGETKHGYETEACFAFHHVNAFEDGREVVVDLCAYPDPRLIQDLYLDRLRAGAPIARPELVRFRLDQTTRAVRRETLTEARPELPRINYHRSNGRPYRYLWATDTGPSGWIEQIIKVDIEDGSSRAWSEPGCYPGEAVFVPRPAATADDDEGLLLSVVFDAWKKTSFLLVLDAASLEELARAHVPHHIPYHFHGHFSEFDD